MLQGLLELGCNGRHEPQSTVLIPGVPKPSGSQGNGQAAAGHKPIVVRPAGRSGRRTPVSYERVEHRARLTWRFREGLVKNG